MTKQIDDVLDTTRQYYNLLERREDDVSTRYVWDGNILFSTGAYSTDAYLLDELGSPLRVGRYDKYSYDEFGVPTGKQPEGKQPFGFTGYQSDSVSGTWYAQAREYVPAHGRFVAQDTHWHIDNMVFGDERERLQNGFLPDAMAMRQSGNLYAYCMGNPVTFIDPAGLTCEDIEDSNFWNRFFDNIIPDFGSFSDVFRFVTDITPLALFGAVFAREHSILNAVRPSNIGAGIWRRWTDEAFANNAALGRRINNFFRWVPYVAVGVYAIGNAIENIENGVSRTRTASDIVADTTVGVTAIQAGGFVATVLSGAKKGGIAGSVVPVKGNLIGAIGGGVTAAVVYGVANASGIRDAISDVVYSGARWVQDTGRNLLNGVRSIFSR